MIHRHFPPPQLHHHHPHNQRNNHYIRQILTTIFALLVGNRFYFVRPRDPAHGCATVGGGSGSCLVPQDRSPCRLRAAQLLRAVCCSWWFRLVPCAELRNRPPGQPCASHPALQPCAPQATRHTSTIMNRARAAHKARSGGGVGSGLSKRAGGVAGETKSRPCFVHLGKTGGLYGVPSAEGRVAVSSIQCELS